MYDVFVRLGCEMLTLENDFSPALFLSDGGLDEWGGLYWSRADGMAPMRVGVSDDLVCHFGVG